MRRQRTRGEGWLPRANVANCVGISLFLFMLGPAVFTSPFPGEKVEAPATKRELMSTVPVGGGMGPVLRAYPRQPPERSNHACARRKPIWRHCRRKQAPSSSLPPRPTLSASMLYLTRLVGWRPFHILFVT